MSKELEFASRKKRLHPGDVVADKYRIMEVAGEGGVGVVYKATHLHTSKTVALKMLHNADPNNPQAFKRFQQEVKASTLLSHPHIVAIDDFGVVDEDHAYLAMEFLDGRNLQAVIRDHSGMPLERFVHIFMQACDALEHAHSHGVVHRDIKPSNFVLVNRHGDKDYLVVVDFGLVKLMMPGEDQKLTTMGEVLGSPLYMSPEQCRGVEVDRRSDVYSLGCVMFQALTGFPPFLGESPMDTMHMHMSKEPLPMREVNTNVLVPSAIESIVTKAMAKSPQLRYQTIAQLKTALESAYKTSSGSYKKSPEALPSAAAAVKDFSNIIKERPGTSPSKQSASSKQSTSIGGAPQKKKKKIWTWLVPVLIAWVVAFTVTGLLVNRLFEQDRIREEQIEQYQQQKEQQLQNIHLQQIHKRKRGAKQAPEAPPGTKSGASQHKQQADEQQ